ncbi:sugar transferase [Halomonas korlensis]|uniref:Sugar transferase involved in LPS biosynthesis (Colanic, teichoic acid) n=1 Tax=Halomonas korlensis TaxID=463301 RepID=A0A1I7FAN9_9GAMM|nr:sugar transferase [Halomonas korlensis]SFU33252.1 Sugar transferase involved in LPS biosynthesis (colanic, teichoic acid) [Halomonas korlensis]
MKLLRRTSQRKKRVLDFTLAAIGLLLAWWIIALAWLAATLNTGRNGFFTQRRIGRGGKPFTLVKIRTMRDSPGLHTTVTRANDPRITRVGRLLRRTKIDELPQLWNVLIGDMSFVGPRPDVTGFADNLVGEERLLLRVRPGITGPATLKYRDEEELLEKTADPETFNRHVIWPDKVRINLHYVHQWSLTEDLKHIWHTVAK